MHDELRGYPEDNVGFSCRQVSAALFRTYPKRLIEGYNHITDYMEDNGIGYFRET